MTEFYCFLASQKERLSQNKMKGHELSPHGPLSRHHI